MSRLCLHCGQDSRSGESYMDWIAPKKIDDDSTTLEKQLWDAADQFRANSGLKAQEYSAPILGLIFYDLQKHDSYLFVRRSNLNASSCRSAG